MASEFILFAATLMKVKSKMLLPRPELNEDGEEIDPREDLIKHLLEYKSTSLWWANLPEWKRIECPNLPEATWCKSSSRSIK